MLNLARIRREQGNNLSGSLDYTIRELRTFERLKDKKGLARAYFEMGYIYKDIFNYQKSIDNISKALILYEELDMESNVVHCQMTMGHVNVDKAIKSKDTMYLKKGLDLYNKVLNYRLKNRGKDEQAIAFINIANLYLEYFRITHREELLYTSISYSRQSMNSSEDIYSTSINLLNIGEAYYYLNEKDKALSYYLDAKKAAAKAGKPAVLLVVMKKITIVRKDLEQYDLALKESKEFVKLAKNISFHDELRSHYALLADIYVELHDYENAYKYRLLYESYSDSVLDKEKTAALVKFQIEFESENKDREIALLSKNQLLQDRQLENEQDTRNYLIATIVLVCLLLLLIYSRYVVKRNAHKTIEEKNLELEKLSIVASKTATGVLITNAAGDLEWFNEGFSKLFKWNSLEEYLNTKGKNIYAVSQNQHIKAIIQQAIDEKISVTYENTMSPKSGEDLWIQTTLTPIFNDQGVLSKMVFVETDVTELKLAKETAERALEIQEQFLANTSHEIRTPMNGIVGLVRRLKETPLTAEQERYLDIIAESSGNLLHVVNDILDISKVRAGKIVFESTEFRLTDLFDTLCITQLYRADEKNIYLKSFVDPKIPPVLLGDPVRLNQVLSNLVGNAVKFTDTGGVLFSAKKVKSQDDNIFLEFSVVDTGIGIAQDKLHYVFESFAQADSHINRRYGGTGLGLSIAKSLIEEQGGTMSIRSTPGEGTTLSFTLAFSIGDPQWNGTTPSYVEGIPAVVDLSDINVLLVEDNHINQMVALFELNKWKAKTDTVESAAEAFELLKEKQYDVILMDVSMPEMDGLAATRYIRSSMPEDKKNIPIIAMTASALAGEREKCLEAGMNDYISKPFNPVNLYCAIVKWGKGESTVAEDSFEVVVEKKKSDKTVNLSLIFERASGNFGYVKEMIELYCTEMPGYLCEIEEAFSAKQRDSMKRSAHKMISPAALFGVNELSQVLREIEIKFQSSEEDLEQLILKSRELFERSVQELKAELEKLETD